MKWSWVIAIFLPPLLCWANPTGSTTQNGAIHISHPEKNVCLIQADDKAIIQWQDFSIAQGELTRFVQPSDQSVVLNQVKGDLPSQILGTLEANGKVFLLNPNGILFGQNAVINVGEFLASTLALSNDDFLNGESFHFAGESRAAIINYGTIRALSGDVTLIGRTVLQHGTIDAETVTLAACKELYLYPRENKHIAICYHDESKEEIGVDCQGNIRALKAHLEADGNLYELAIHQDGAIDALTVCERGGSILLVAEEGSIEMNGALNAPGGEIVATGDTVQVKGQAILDTSHASEPGTILLLSETLTSVEKEAQCLSNALDEGRGGDIVCFSDGLSLFDGHAEVRGEEGGFIEVSGMQGTHFHGTTDRTGSKGVAGTLLLDPEANFTITKAYDYNYEKKGESKIPTADVANMTIDTLLKELRSGPVVIQTTYEGEGGLEGHIVVSSDVFHTYNSPHALTLDSGGEGGIIWNGSLINEGKGDITLLASRGGVLFEPTDYTTPVMGQTGGHLSIGTAKNPIEGNIVLAGNREQMAGCVATGRGNLSIFGTKSLMLNSKEKAPAVMQVRDGNLSVHVQGKIELNGLGGSKAELRSFGHGNIQIQKGSSLKLNAISAPALISTAFRQGNITIENIAKGITLNAQNERSSIEAGSGSIRMHHIGSDLSLISENASASIGTRGPIHLQIGGGLFIDGGDASALIGSDELVEVLAGQTALLCANRGEAAIRSSKGILVHVQEDMILCGSENEKVRLESPSTSVFVGHDLELFSDAAMIATKGPLVISVGHDLTLSDPSHSKQAFLSGAKVQMSLNHTLHTKDRSGIYSTEGALLIFVGEEMFLDQATRLRAAGGALDLVSLRGNIHLAQNTEIEALSDSLSLSAGKSVILDGFSSAKSYGEKGMKVVVDQLHPTSIGEGGFALHENAALETGDAPLQIYTSRRSQNTIEGTMNGTQIAMAPHFLSTKEEQWGIFYPTESAATFLTSAPFTVLYKESGQIQIGVDGVSQKTHDRIVINYIGPFISELYRDLASYNTFTADTETFFSNTPFSIKRRYFPHRFVPPFH